MTHLSCRGAQHDQQLFTNVDSGTQSTDPVPDNIDSTSEDPKIPSRRASSESPAQPQTLEKPKVITQLQGRSLMSNQSIALCQLPDFGGAYKPPIPLHGVLSSRPYIPQCRLSIASSPLLPLIPGGSALHGGLVPTGGP